MLKKLFPVILLLSLSFLFSCKKEYKCVCETMDGKTEEFEIEGADEDEAQTGCEAYEIDANKSCELE